jgi:hypothetical protein
VIKATIKPRYWLQVKLSTFGQFKAQKKFLKLSFSHLYTKYLRDHIIEGINQL